MRKIRMLKEHREDTSDYVKSMTDTCYNNIPKVRSMYQPGPQCVTPVLECVTTKIW